MTKETKIFEYIGRHLFNHAFQCEDVWCVCHASTFIDAICDLRDEYPKFIEEVQELLDRKEHEKKPIKNLRSKFD